MKKCQKAWQEKLTIQRKSAELHKMRAQSFKKTVVGLSESLDQQQQHRANQLARKKAEIQRQKFDRVNEETVAQWQNSNCECYQSLKQTGTFESEISQNHYPQELNRESRNLVLYAQSHNSPEYSQRLCHDKADNKDSHHQESHQHYAPPMASHITTQSGCLSTQRGEPLFFNEIVPISCMNTEQEGQLQSKVSRNG